MSQCVDITQNPDGSLRLEPSSSTDLQACPYVLQSGAEVGNSPLYLTPSQGVEISVAVIGVWAIAWGFKQVAKVFSSGDSNETND
jgi:hypothetical protein